MEGHRIATNGIYLHVVQAGSHDGPLVILLHGFPEFHYSWRYQVSDLASAGFRVWVPDQRGYNLSAKPKKTAAYALDELSADILGLIDAAGCDQAHLIGHDWGAAVAWWLAANHPERLMRMVVLNVPHPAVMYRQLRRSMNQLRRSWYMFFFQIPWLPEKLAAMSDWHLVAKTLTASSRPGTFSPGDLARYRRAWAQPRAFRSMLNWYRAIVRRPPPLAGPQRIAVPTLLIWGRRDRFLGAEMAQPSIDLCHDGHLVWLNDATHWVQHEEYLHVNRLIRAFLNRETLD